MPARLLHIPIRFGLDGKIHRNRVRQVAWRVSPVEMDLVDERRGARCFTMPDGRSLLVVDQRLTAPADIEEVLRVRSFEALESVENAGSETFRARWSRPQPMDPGAADVMAVHEICEAARASWIGRFHFREEDRDRGIPGLRSPQIGALHAVLAHWKVSDRPATVVMPTGTGKTETMLALLVSQRFARLLVIVPTVALRDQVSRKFMTLGVLKERGVVDAEALHPVVGLLEHRPSTVEEVDDVFGRCNVVVTTMDIAGRCDEAVQEWMAEGCSHLFINEAHHISARTWDAFRRRMLSKVILQFTATPFRTDGRNVDGKVIFNYPLRKAQEEDYFRPVSVFSEAGADVEIASAALGQLEEDRAEGPAHLVMARVDSIERAEAVHAVYMGVASEHRPLLVHSKLPSGERQAALRAIRGGGSRIIICVDMLGEGFGKSKSKL